MKRLALCQNEDDIPGFIPGIKTRTWLNAKKKNGKPGFMPEVRILTWLYARILFVLKGFISTLHCKGKHNFFTDKHFSRFFYKNF